MSLVSRVGRRGWRARLAMLALYCLLICGATITVYPFLVMGFLGFKGPTDQNDPKLIPTFWTASGLEGRGKVADDTLFGKYLNDKYAGDLNNIASTRSGVADGALVSKYEDFLATLPLDSWTAGFRTAPTQVTGRLSVAYQRWLRGRYPTIDAVNRAYNEQNVAFQTTAPPSELLDKPNWRPVRDAKYRDWQEFKRQLPAEFRIPVRGQRMFQAFAQTRARSQFDQVPSDVRGSATSFEELCVPKSGSWLSEFRSKALPARFLTASVEDAWHKFVGADVPMPIEAYERRFVGDHETQIRSEMTWRNYEYVLSYVLINGRILLNTVIFAVLAILTQLTVNPLAAYALSRYPMRSTGRILLFLLATMAFPAEVSMIPSFLLLKSLGLLNTFAALVLPTAASGYTIFLLKGFFDGLPTELFEAAQLDGAKESTMMFKVTLPLSLPVFGYLSLLAFMGAYGSFLYAFLVAQDRRIWTLMVFIYQLQGSAPKAVVMAALTVAALPTMLVFLASQRVIMRGALLPSER